MFALPDPPKGTDGYSLAYLQMDVPSCFRDALLRHHQHLVTLAGNLEAARRLTDQVIRLLDEAVAGYRTELAANLMAPGEDRNA